MRRQRNSTCAFTGLVGSRRPPPIPRARRYVARKLVKCTGGPYAGRQLSLSLSGLSTLQFRAGVKVGRYLGGSWVNA